MWIRQKEFTCERAEIFQKYQRLALNIYLGTVLVLCVLFFKWQRI